MFVRIHYNFVYFTTKSTQRHHLSSQYRHNDNICLTSQWRFSSTYTHIFLTAASERASIGRFPDTTSFRQAFNIDKPADELNLFLTDRQDTRAHIQKRLVCLRVT